MRTDQAIGCVNMSGSLLTDRRYVVSNKPICVKCERELEKVRSGVKVVEMFQGNKEIYRVWNADKYRCPTCKIEAVIDFAGRPLAQHFNYDDIDGLVAELKRLKYEVIYNFEGGRPDDKDSTE